jgi:hypothetical protein
MKEWITQVDFIELIFAIGIIVAGIYAVSAKDKETAALCLGACIMFIKGKMK